MWIFYAPQTLQMYIFALLLDKFNIKLNFELYNWTYFMQNFAYSTMFYAFLCIIEPNWTKIELFILHNWTYFIHLTKLLNYDSNLKLNCDGFVETN